LAIREFQYLPVSEEASSLKPIALRHDFCEVECLPENDRCVTASTTKPYDTKVDMSVLSEPKIVFE
jgi:hypothetical protein